MPPVDTKKDWFPKKSSGRLYVIYRVGGMYMGRAANTARVVTLKVVDGDAEGPSRIVRHPLPLQVVARLRQEIVAGEWAPGERVTEQLLTERNGVSRTPLREALKTVEAEGLLVLLPNRGAVITEPTLEDTEDKLRVLGTLEVMAAGLACLRASNAEIAALEKLHKRMMDAHKRRQATRYFDLNDQVHEALIEAAHSRTLSDLATSLNRHIRRARLIANFRETLNDHSKVEHEAIMEALVARDEKAAKLAIERHRESVLSKLLTTADTVAAAAR